MAQPAAGGESDRSSLIYACPLVSKLAGSRSRAAVCLIVNPAAGGGRAGRWAPAVVEELRGYGLEVRRQDTRDLAHARVLAREAAEAGEHAVALGGDGLAGAVADALRDVPGAVLGVLPGGRGNDLARVLGIPLDARAACATIARGTARPLDLGAVGDGRTTAGEAGGHKARGEAGSSKATGDAEGSKAKGDEGANGKAAMGEAGGGEAKDGGVANGEAAGDEAVERTFVGIASVGFDSEANRIANEAPARLGNLVYAYGALRALASWRPAHFTVVLDPPAGRRIEFSGYTVAAANSRDYGGGMQIAPAALLDDGLLDVVLIEAVSRPRFVANLPRVFRGTHVQLPQVRVLRAAEVEISADRPFTVYADGDPIGELPARVRAVRHALRVLVPADAQAAAFSQQTGGMASRARG